MYLIASKYFTDRDDEKDEGPELLLIIMVRLYHD